MNISNYWHSGCAPRMEVNGSWEVVVDGLSVHIYGNITNGLKPGYTGFYGYSVTAWVGVDGGNWQSFNVTNNNISGTGYFDVTSTVSAGNHTAAVYVSCGETGGCDGGHINVEVASYSFTATNPYTAPSYDIFSATNIVKVGRDAVSVNYKINGGTNNLDWVRLKSNGHTYDISKNKGNSLWGSFTPQYSDGFKDASSYNVSVRFSDSHSEYETGTKTFYTYQEPKLNNSLTIQTNPQSAAMSNKFTITGTNNRAWSSLENEFQTRYKIKRGSDSYTDWSNLGNITEWSRTASEMRSLVSKSYDGQGITLQMERYSPSANWESTNKPTVTFKIYYRPRNGISDASYKFTDSSGASVSKNQRLQKDKNVYISWSYDTTVANAGYVQGYRIRLYNDSGTVVKTYYTTDENTKNYTIPIADIPQGQYTKIDITPYFKNDTTDTSNYWYYNGTISKIDFVFVRRGYLYYKDSSGTWHDCGYLYEKDNSGTERHCQTLYVKDSSGTERIIDLY